MLILNIDFFTFAFMFSFIMIRKLPITKITRELYVQDRVIWKWSKPCVKFELQTIGYFKTNLVLQVKL